MGGRRKVLGGTIVGLSTLIGLVFLVLNRVTPVSQQEAVRRFHEERREIGHNPGASPAPATLADGSEREIGSQEKGVSGVPGPGSQPADAPAQGGGGSSRASGVRTGAGEHEASDVVERWPTMPSVVRPAEGVYSYETVGHEGFEGIFDREFPSVSHRTIIHTGPRTWSDHTIFSEERDSASSFAFGQNRRLVHSQRNRIAFPPYERDETIIFAPPVVSTVVPWSPGRAWRGSWSGDTYGSYEARTLRKELVEVDDRQVKAWVDQLEVVLHGRIEGTATVTRWLSPRHGLTLREEYHADAWMGPLHYIAEWSVKLRSLQPSH